MRLPSSLAACLLSFQLYSQAGASLIPAPSGISSLEGSCILDRAWSISIPPALGEATSKLLITELEALRPGVKNSTGTLRIVLSLVGIDTISPPEQYQLHVGPDRIDLSSATAAGLYRGSRTLVQLLEGQRTTIPCLSITDQPRFPWRGMHLDVCRHFFPVEFVKTYIDLLARYKMNTFHWHLTDDQGWRIEIKKYPKLTEVGAWRDGSMIGPYSDRRFDSTRYGGFYTQEQIRDVVAYATARHITIVPEIEMPGHAMAALAAYPELSCTGGPFEVAKGWGVFDDVFCAKEGTFTFLENVLAEVMDLFPGKYLHIGGDECPKTRWKECLTCQALMEKQGLKDEHELQSYFIQRIERFVNAKGRKIIGWDEILEGGLAPNAAVMSWRGTEGGIAAARSGHYAVMSPGSHCYFDHYQGDPAQEPLAIGGYTTVQKVYGYEPVPDSLTVYQARFILGAQGNVWTEYIATPEHVEYMALPRMIALSEVLWSPKEMRKEADFIARLISEFSTLDAKQINYSRSLYQAKLTPLPTTTPGEVMVTAMCDAPNTETVLWWSQRPANVMIADGVRFTSDVQVSGWVIANGGAFRSDTSTLELNFNMATARTITCDPLPSERYDDGGPFTLVDGVLARDRRVNTEWLGWTGKDVTITIDLGKSTHFTHIDVGALDETWSWIHLPSAVRIGTGDDPEKIELSAATMIRTEGSNKVACTLNGDFNARYLRLKVSAVKHIPDGMPGAGSAAWVFLDEVTVR